jgi:hypothetical protein
VRRYLTTYLWYEDRLCSLSTAHLLLLSFLCLGVLSLLGHRWVQFMEDLAFLLSESDAATFFALLGLLLLTSVALWLLALASATLGQRLILSRSRR